MSFDATQQIAEAADRPSNKDDPSVLTPGRFPGSVEEHEVCPVLRQDGATQPGRVRQEIFVRDPLIRETRLVAPFGVEAALPELAREILENVLVGEDADAYTRHGRLLALTYSRYTAAFRSKSSSTRLGLAA